MVPPQVISMVVQCQIFLYVERRGSYGGVHGIACLIGGNNVPLRKDGGVYNGLLHVADLFPLISYAAGVNISTLMPSLDGADGSALWRSINDDTVSARTEILINIDPQIQQVENGVLEFFALRMGDWKILSGMSPGEWWPLGGTIEGADTKDLLRNLTSTYLGEVVNEKELTHLRLLSTGTNGQLSLHANASLYLYNITQDPQERNNVASQNPRIVQELLTRVAEYNQGAEPARYPPADPNGNPASQGRDYWAPWD